MDKKILSKPVTVVTYNKPQMYATRKAAIADMFDAATSCDGSEAERYWRVYADLVSTTNDTVTDAE